MIGTQISHITFFSKVYIMYHTYHVFTRFSSTMVLDRRGRTMLWWGFLNSDFLSPVSMPFAARAKLRRNSNGCLAGMG